jgi:hypothetical protein
MNSGSATKNPLQMDWGGRAGMVALVPVGAHGMRPAARWARFVSLLLVYLSRASISCLNHNSHVALIRIGLQRCAASRFSAPTSGDFVVHRCRHDHTSEYLLQQIEPIEQTQANQGVALAITVILP